MSNYSEFIKQAQAASGGKNYSKSDLVDLATAMLNDPQCSISTFVKKGDTYEEKVFHPSQAVRNNVIGPVLKAYGVDKAEMARMDSFQFPRAAGEAQADFALLMIKQYISANGMGRKLTLPMTSPNETVQSISCESAEEEKRATTMIVRNDDGTYSTTPTGKVVTTKAHEKVKVGNRVPVWLKETVDAK
jgi:hypothetical protein